MPLAVTVLDSKMSYVPSLDLKQKYTSKITIGKTGADEPGDSYGLMIYYNNRLIRAYDKIGSQKKVGQMVSISNICSTNFLLNMFLFAVG